MRIMVSMTVLNKPPPRTRELGNLYSNKTERLTTPGVTVGLGHVYEQGGSVEDQSVCLM